MAFLRKTAQCPFCNSKRFTVSLFVNDMPSTGQPSELGQRLTLYCAKCNRQVFEVVMAQDKQVSARGVSVCDRCAQELRRTRRPWREEDTAKVTYPLGTESCPRCGSKLTTYWWHGWDYII